MAFSALPTEAWNSRMPSLDCGPTAVLALASSAAAAALCVGRAAASIDRAAGWLAAAAGRGRRMVFVGAGTSGRLAAMEASELWPTFQVKAEAAIAGGAKAMLKAVEGAEDSRSQGRAVGARCGAGDVAVGVTASGVTPFVEEALAEAARRGARTVLVTANPKSRIAADARVLLATGAEPLAGSTRMNAGTATKIALNAMTTCAMAKLGKTWRNRMVDVAPTNAKLRDRAVRLVSELGGVGAARARRLLSRAGAVKPAIVMARKGCRAPEAHQRLRGAGGSLRRLLGS